MCRTQLFGLHDDDRGGILLLTAQLPRATGYVLDASPDTTRKWCDHLMANSLPNFTPEQRAAHLQKSKETRAKRAEFTARLRTGEISGAEGLEEALADEVLAKIRLTGFLRALPGWGKVSVEHFLQDNSIAENRRLSGLGIHQLDELRRAVAG